MISLVLLFLVLQLQQQQHVTSLLAVVGDQPLPAPAVEGELVSQQQDLLVEEERNGGSQLPLVSDAPVSPVSPVKSEATNAAMSSSSSTVPVSVMVYCLQPHMNQRHV